MSKTVILTGLRASNDLHLGNYFGAILPLVDKAKAQAGEYQVNLFVVDLHTLTTPTKYDTMYQQVLDNLKAYTAAGLPLDNPDVFLYRQSYIPANSEMAWIIDCFTGFGELSRMTQFKDKSAKQGQDRLSVGLFNYPALMAADILLYNASYVPVGDDQSQHLEFTRDIAQRLNRQFGDLFVVPKPVAEQHQFFGKDQGLRVRDLIDPSKKMSKSDETGNGVIFLTDTEEIVRKKIMGATTDSMNKVKYDMQNQPGVSNLLQILALATGRTLSTVCQEHEGQATYGPLKQAVSDATVNFLKEFQTRLETVDDQAVLTKLENSERAMNEIANQTLLNVQQAVGLRPKA